MKIRPAIGIGLIDGAILSCLAFAGPQVAVALTVAAGIMLYGALSAIGLPLILLVTSHVSQLPGMSDTVIRLGKWFAVGLFFALAAPRLIAKDGIRILAFDRVESHFMLFLLWAAVCSFFAIAPANSFLETLRLLLMIPVYLITRRLCSSRAHLLTLSIGFAIAVSMGFLACYYQVQTEGLIRVRGMFQNANMLGVFLSFAIPGVAIGFFLTKSRLLKLALSFVIFVGIISLILSWSRSAYFSLAIQVIAYLIIERRRRVLSLLAAAAVAALLVFVAVPQFRQLGVDALRLKGGTTHRTLLWEKGMGAFAENPVFGVGFEAPIEAITGKIMWNDLVEYILYKDTQSRFVPHNFYIFLLMSTGVIGFALMGLFYRTAVVGQLRQRQNTAVQQRQKLHSVTIAMLLGTLGYAFFESHAFLGHGSWAVYFWILLGMANSEALPTLSDQRVA